MSASVRFNQASLFQKTKRLFIALGDIGRDNYLKQDLARFTKDIIYKRVKSGFGVNSVKTPFLSTRKERFQPLSKGYKRYRRTGIVEFTYQNKKGKKKKASIKLGVPSLGEFGKPDKSNLTFSGQLLNSMTFDIKALGFTILIPGTKRRGESLTNAKLAKYVSDNGRPFMNLTAGEIRIVKSRMKKQIQKRLKQLLR